MSSMLFANCSLIFLATYRAWTSVPESISLTASWSLSTVTPAIAQISTQCSPANQRMASSRSRLATRRCSAALRVEPVVRASVIACKITALAITLPQDAGDFDDRARVFFVEAVEEVHFADLPVIGIHSPFHGIEDERGVQVGAPRGIEYLNAYSKIAGKQCLKSRALKLE